VRIEADLLGRRVPLQVVRVVVLFLGRHPLGVVNGADVSDDVDTAA
jgi:hypothetical protein